MVDAVLLFPGQGSQYVGMGEYLLDKFPDSEYWFDKANNILGFDIKHAMCKGTAEDLRQTKITQNAIFLYSFIGLQSLPHSYKRKAVAGHSLGEFTALVAAEVLTFEDALNLVNLRAQAMQKACEKIPSTMAAVLGLEDEKIVEICIQIKSEIVVPANFNCPGQVVISGTQKGIELAKENLIQAGAKRVLPLAVGGAFHSPLMQSAEEMLGQSIMNTPFNTPLCPIYQNVSAKGETDVNIIRQNIIAQLTRSVEWTKTIQQLSKDGLTNFIEVGPGKVLQGLLPKIIPNAEAIHWENLFIKA